MSTIIQSTAATYPWKSLPGQVRLCHVSDCGAQESTPGAGDAGVASAAVAALVTALKPDVVFTTGDNVHPGYNDYPTYFGTWYAQMLARGACFPGVGNHDWDYDNLAPFLAYFSGPQNNRYYELLLGPAHIFVLDSDDREPDGNAVDSQQYDWFVDKLGRSTAAWKIAALHHSPYTSYAAYAPGSLTVRWGFEDLGIDLVISGNSHVYERFLIGGIPYVVDSLGGGARRTLPASYANRIASYTADWGSLFLDINATRLVGTLYNTSQVVCDQFTLEK